MLDFAGRTGWLHTHKKIYEMRIGGFPCHGTAELPRIPSGHEEGKRRLVLIKCGQSSEKTIPRRILRSSPKVRAVNIDFLSKETRPGL